MPTWVSVHALTRDQCVPSKVVTHLNCRC